MGTTKRVAIIGAGVAGLHLGLWLRKYGVEATIYTNRSAKEVRDGRIMNSVAHMESTRALERELDIEHWQDPRYGYTSHYHYNAWGESRRFRGDFKKPSRAIDYRIYLPRLMQDFEERGGHIDYREVSVGDIEALTDDFDQVVVSTGKGQIGGLFPRRADKSPYEEPQRKLAVGLWHGVAPRDPKGVEISVVPDFGELLTIPIWSFDGAVHALLFESVPGGDQEVLTDQRYAEDPDGYRDIVLKILRENHPSVYERVDESTFQLQGENDILQGAFTPVMREDYVRLSNGKFLVALGDVHLTMDPIQAQGGNSAAYSAKVLADAIVEDDVFDETFVRKVALRRAERLEASNDWINIMIRNPSSEQIPPLFSAMAENKELADLYTENFNHPTQQLSLVGSMDRVNATIERH